MEDHNDFSHAGDGVKATVMRCRWCERGFMEYRNKDEIVVLDCREQYKRRNVHGTNVRKQGYKIFNPICSLEILFECWVSREHAREFNRIHGGDPREERTLGNAD